MELNLKNPLIVFDIEATGDRVTKDRIVEIGMIKIHPDGKEETYEKRINPEVPIPTIDKHGGLDQYLNNTSSRLLTDKALKIKKQIIKNVGSQAN